ncbi:nectin-4 isoform X5 [Sturnira hondurensis]|uniref:nectin-4 isoform X5 n=1 Tax=Sturnira hondurensis TaxID=192404 RepID=UPI00187AC73C|nr:nectin-4 isoform X5 [Sturnira hondurensis]
MWGPELWLLLLLLASLTGQCAAGELESADLVTVVLGQDARLPCFYRGDPDEQVAQVAWARRDGGEGLRELALLHAQYGLHVSPGYEGRVEQPPPPRNPLDGAVLLRNAVQADEGEYECRVSTFPAGSFQARLQLRVLVPPLPSLNPGPALEEGQGLTLAASCTAEGSPAPTVTWDTEVKGTTYNRSFAHSRSAAVTSEFHLVPSRSMNGQPLTCVVSHPGLLQDQRITHVLQVAFLAEASVRGLEDRKLWQVGREGATLKCLSEGQPPPSYNWTRLDGPLPSGVRVEGDTLGFPPLAPEHSGVYVCHVSNELSSRDSRVTVEVAADPEETTGKQVDVVSASVVARAMAAVPTVSLPELRSLLAAGRARLIDVRSREEAAAGTIPGALNIPVSELEGALQMDAAAFQALYSVEKPKLEDENLIFFCQMGRRGLQATQLAQGLGYRGARNYMGAYREWFQKGG